MDLYPDPYLLLRLLHIGSAAVLFGTGLGIAFFMFVAERSGDVRHIAITARHVVLADAIFTAIAVVVQPLSGLALIHMAGWPWDTPWLIWTYVLYVVAAAAWLPVVWIQMRLAKLASAADAHGTALPPAFHQLYRIWFWLGWPGFLSVAGIFVLMIFKPVWA